MSDRVPRPKPTDTLVLVAAVDACLKDLAAAFPRADAYGELPAHVRGFLASDLAHALPLMDGFSIGKDLDNRGWYVDGAVVAVLHQPFLTAALSAAVREWVKAHDVQPRLAVGAPVTYPVALPDGVEQRRGVIKRVVAETAVYLVNDRGSTRLRAVPFEDATLDQDSND